MIHHEVQASEYVVCTHKGLESDIHLTYDYLYGPWSELSERTFADYDFEVWDDRYNPESPDNEIDIYVALSNSAIDPK
jgi:AraC family transcriptional regulator